jgi:hypothetical protein
MSTPPILVPISALDETGPAFASATAKAEAFQASISRTSGSFKEARGAAMLLGEEVGIHMNRHLVTALASSKLLQGALAAAFPIVAAIGFAEIIGRIPDAIQKATDFFGGFTAAAKTAMEEAVKSNEKILTQFKTIAEGYHALAILQEESTKNAATAPKSDMEGTGSTALQWGKAAGPVGALAGYFYQIYETRKKINDVAAADFHLSDLQVKALEQLTKLTDERNKKEEEANAKAAAAAEAAAKAAQRHREELDKMLASLIAVAEKLPVIGWSQESLTRTGTGRMPLQAGTDFMSSVVQPDDSLSKKHLQDLQDQKGWYDETRTAAEKFQVEVAKLNALFGSNQGEVYQRALKDITQRYSETYKAAEKFGDAVGKAAVEGLLMGKSWKNIMDSLLVTILQLIVKMTLLKSLQQSSAGSTGVGGFLEGILSGFAGGKAGGGSVSGGMSYLVGERGPELFTPGSSGAITPNGAFGGGGGDTYIDARGADASVEQRIMRLLPIIEERAAQKGAAIAQQRSLRR